MIVTVSARCERLPRAPAPARAAPSVRLAAPPPYTPGLPPIHPHPAARTSPPHCGFSEPSFAVSGTVPGGSPGPAPEPDAQLTVAYSTVDNFAENVDGEAAESFFHAQAVEGIGAGSGGSGG